MVTDLTSHVGPLQQDASDPARSTVSAVIGPLETRDLTGHTGTLLLNLVDNYNVRGTLPEARSVANGGAKLSL